MEEIGEVRGIKVFIDEFKGMWWVNIARWPRVVKLNVDDVDKIVEMLIKAKETANDKA